MTTKITSKIKETSIIGSNHKAKIKQPQTNKLFTWAPCGSTRIFVSLVFCWIQLLTGAYCPKHHREVFLKCHRLEMALNYGRATLFSILSTMSVSQPLSPAVWTNLVRAGITRVKPTRRGCRAGRLKRRAIATLLSNSRQPSVQMGYSGFLEQNVNKVTGN